MSLSPKDVIAGLVGDKEAKILKVAIRVYGDDVSAILNGLHMLSARLAIAADIKPEDFSAGMKHHWDFVAAAINEYAEQKSRH